MKLTKSFLIVLLTGAAVLAQGPPPGGGGRGFGHGMAGGMPGGPGGFGGHGRKLVTGAPYTADVNMTHTRTLVDGNVIQQTMTGTAARDASGRTYSSETSTGGPLGQTGPVTRISIFDPVAGYSYELDPATKTATRRALHAPPDGAGGGKWNQTANAPTPPANPNVVKTDLPAKIVNGVNATGRSTTRTIPAGAIGNAKPLVSTSETWFSPDLQVVVSSTMNDPRGGSSAYALTNIQKTADPTLFQVPAGYTVTDAPRGARGGFGPGGMPPPPPHEED